MNRNERLPTLTEMILSSNDLLRSQINTAMPGIIQKFDPVKQTCEIKPAIMYRMEKMDGTFAWVNLPLLVDCPVIFPGAGGFTLTFPVQPNDEALIIFSQRCIDAWYSSGGVNNIQSDIRLHDLSDGFVLAGIRSQPNIIPNFNTDSVQLRNNSGDTYVQLSEDSIILNATNSVTINAGSVIINGPVTQSGGDMTSDGISAQNHTHSGVQPGGSNTGGPS